MMILTMFIPIFKSSITIGWNIVETNAKWEKNKVNENRRQIKFVYLSSRYSLILNY